MSIKKIYKIEDIIKVNLEDTLSHALSILHSSHDSAFVVDENNELKGIINPYYCVIKKSFPSNAKVKHCMFKPPKIKLNTPLNEASRLMIHSRLHYLPVYKDETFVGILSARRIMDYVKNHHMLNCKIADYIRRKKPLITIREDEFISKAVSLFKAYKISKLVVISRDYKLRGIITHFDIIAYLSTPKEKKTMNMNNNKVPYMKKPVKNFMKTQVITLDGSATLNQAAKLILDKEIGSIVIVDYQYRPIGIVTTRDILSLVSEKRSFPKLELVKQQLSGASERIVKMFSSRLIKHLVKNKSVDRVKLVVKEEKSGGFFRAAVSFFSKDNKIIRFAVEEGHNLSRVLADTLRKSIRRK